MKLKSSRKVLVTFGLTAGAVLGSAGIAAAFAHPRQTTPTSDSTVTTEVTGASDTSGSTGASGSTGTTSSPTAGRSNEDPTHEATESAQREADEAAGHFGRGDGDHHGGRRGHGHSNTDPAHEAAESPERAAEEAKDDAAAADGSTSTTVPAAPATTTGASGA
jgi:hypothetical protein